MFIWTNDFIETIAVEIVNKNIIFNKPTVQALDSYFIVSAKENSNVTNSTIANENHSSITPEIDLPPTIRRNAPIINCTDFSVNGITNFCQNSWWYCTSPIVQHQYSDFIKTWSIKHWVTSLERLYSKNWSQEVRT